MLDLTGHEHRGSWGNMRIVLRDDDFGWNNEAFSHLLQLCQRYEFPLAAGAIPVACQSMGGEEWCTQRYLEILPHGHSHRNNQSTGKSGEFFHEHDHEVGVKELKESFAYLAAEFADIFYPVFIPPWNRISDEFLTELPKLGYLGVARFGDNQFATEFPEFNSQVDLHTRKVGMYESVDDVIADIEIAWQAQAENSPRFVGVMLHHTKMQPQDFAFLAKVFDRFAERKFEFWTYREAYAAWKVWRDYG